MDVVTLVQGDEASDLTPLFLVHPVTGIGLPFMRLESLSEYDDRPVYGITSPMHCQGGEDFKFPPSLKALAELYVEEITNIQPEGPYLLGGWSMGGMIAMFMAQALEAAGQEILKVIMIDSGNPEIFPNFGCFEEHRQFANATFERTIAIGGLQVDGPQEPPSPKLSPLDYDSGEDYMMASGRYSPPAWTSPSSSSTTVSSSASSIFDQAGPFSSDGLVLSPDCMSEKTDYFTDDEYDCDSDDEDEAPYVQNLLRLMKLHVHHGIGLIAGVQPGELLADGAKFNFDAVLIKCTSEVTKLEGLFANHEGARLIQTVMHEQNMRWDPARFKSFQSIPFSGDHDSAFQPQYVGELSAILRECIEDLD
ncbi:hypothetical protein HIM_02150 [Hirsutella minnesotensis 3608]|nr:hypothetical protein HIM_02150 [Hirsutella minnesotensis 3608]